MKKLCIILRSAYPTASAEHRRLNEEVDFDSKTVKETLTDYDIVEITIPLPTKQSVIGDRINCALSTISKEYETCHIVLNTHGRPGRSDLPNEAVKQVLKTLSDSNITVTQISALQCNGMLAVSPKSPVDSVKSPYGAFRRRKSSMSILQQKLQQLETSRPMSLEIRGCRDAYDPEKDKALVIAILKGYGVLSLPVKTEAYKSTSLESCLHVLRSIDIIKTTPHAQRTESKAYQMATNTLGIVMNAMKKNIGNYLTHITALKLENTPLFKALETFAGSKGLILKSSTVDVIYKLWIKNYKVFSEERLSVFNQYCEYCLASLDAQKDEPKPSDARFNSSGHTFFGITPSSPNQAPHSEMPSACTLFQ